MNGSASTHGSHGEPDGSVSGGCNITMEALRRCCSLSPQDCHHQRPRRRCGEDGEAALGALRQARAKAIEQGNPQGPWSSRTRFESGRDRLEPSSMSIHVVRDWLGLVPLPGLARLALHRVKVARPPTSSPHAAATLSSSLCTHSIPSSPSPQSLTTQE